MASNLPSPGLSGGALSPAAAAAATTTTTSKPQRVLACVLCQQRKIKCDRRFPCANCIKASAQCVPAALVPRQRRRRFPERELLDRLRHYESLLREHNVSFEPLHGNIAESPNLEAQSQGRSAQKQRARHAAMADPDQGSATDVPGYRAKNFWHAMNRRKSQDSDNDDSNDSDQDLDDDSSLYVLRQNVVKNAWDSLYLSNDHLLFCSRNTTVQLAALHPTQVQIFKLWQIYLDNVNPLIKVTHTPTLQARIIDAASDVTTINPSLEALMFSIYCVAVFSLDQEHCRVLFGTPRQDVLRGYQLGAREALLNCGFLKSSDRDCLTALHLYLLSVKPDSDPRALSSVLGAAIRIAQRMGIHTEAANVKHNVLEAEMRRRLWWSLVLFDARMSEITDLKLSNLIPTWDCKVPLNVNDFDLRAEMKNPPIVYSQPSEGLFAVMRSEIGDFTRHDPAHLDFVNPAYKFLANRRPSMRTLEADDLDALEHGLESKYLNSCEPENPLHFMTVWTTRIAIAKSRFLHQLSTSSHMTEDQREAQRDAGVLAARTMLECDTKLMSSSFIKGFRWQIYLHFPFPAYVHLVQDLRKRPVGDHAEKAWVAMSENCTARFMEMDNKDNPMDRKDNPFYRIFAGLVLQAWAARETATGQSEVPPVIVSQIRQRVADMQAQANGNDTPRTPEPMEFGSFETLYDMGSINNMTPQSAPFPTDTAGFDNSQWGWPAPNWIPMLGQGW